MDLPNEHNALLILDRIEGHVGASDSKLSSYLSALREELRKADKKQRDNAEVIAQYEEAYEKLTSPANRVGIFIRHLDDGNVEVLLGDSEYVAMVDPKVDTDVLKPGMRVRLNDAYAVLGQMSGSSIGSVVKVADIREDGRLRINGEGQSGSGDLILRSEALAGTEIKAGDEVRLDPSRKVALEHFPREDTKDYFIEDIHETEWSKIGGQEEAIELIRETIEHPLLYPEIYERFEKKPIKGLLLYGPPGCGKTLIGKAVAYNLAKEVSGRTGKETKECFMHISGPKILNMWLGETERMVREIFTTARNKAKEGHLVVIFIDEAESILRTRSSGRWLNISNTVVPQFCAEMDGLVELENVVLIITSNRPDYIDPAILRPERIDRKIRVRRPDKEACREILSIYLTDKLPIDPEFSKMNDGDACARKALVESTLASLWKESKQTEFLKIQMRSSESKTLYWKDLVSGALLKSVVDRAKDIAIRRAIADPKTTHGLNAEDLEEALKAEYAENEIFPKSDAMEDWLKLLDFEPDNVINVRPVGVSKGEEFARKTII
ncbi:MAG: AAA family ATPase [Fimbriimonadaceae bacterium]